MLVSVPASYAQTIPITISADMDKVVFDGKWTFGNEWKPSSLEQVGTPSGYLYIRTAHQDNFVYVFVDAALDTHPVMYADRATICFDSNNDKSTSADSDDYCFVAALGRNSTVTLQGGSPLAISDNFKKISAPDAFIGIGGISSDQDIYAQIPHPSFEFKIPKELLGKSDSYGFFVQYYDASSDKFYSWPTAEDSTFYSHIPSPSKWGQIISPDHTLPEFSTPTMILLPSLIFIIYLTRNKISR